MSFPWPHLRASCAVWLWFAVVQNNRDRQEGRRVGHRAHRGMISALHGLDAGAGDEFVDFGLQQVAPVVGSLPNPPI